MMSNSMSESEKEILTGCVSFCTQWFDVCVCIRVRGLYLVCFFLCSASCVLYTYTHLIGRVNGLGWQRSDDSGGAFLPRRFDYACQA